MTTDTVLFAAHLKAHGYSVTKQRRAVFELLAGREPQSMRDLCASAVPQMDRASVYRNVEVFEKTGIVRRINIGWKYKLELSDAFTGHHHHLSCLRCKKIIQINERELESFIDKLATGHNFKPSEHQIEIQGYCEMCTVKQI